MQLLEKKLDMIKNRLKIAVLYQSLPLPGIFGVTKPMKANGYVDGSADIAFSLQQKGFQVCTPQKYPDVDIDKHWAFDDTIEGILYALRMNANFIWTNTVLHDHHPIYQIDNEQFTHLGTNKKLQNLDDKVVAYQFLKAHDFYTIQHFIVGNYDNLSFCLTNSVINESVIADCIKKRNMRFPLVVKPIRGRGSEGVSVVFNFQELHAAINFIINTTFNFSDRVFKRFGNAALIEEFLPGEEITITILPPGIYKINSEYCHKEAHWCLPVLKRTGHQHLILPSIGQLPPAENSVAIFENHKIKNIISRAIKLAEIAQCIQPLRIDCRIDTRGDYQMFDINIKPAITYSERINQPSQESLISFSAKHIDLSYADLLIGIISGHFYSLPEAALC